MINAQEAYRKSIINSNAKFYLEELEKAINKSISLGDFSATIPVYLEEPSDILNQKNNSLNIKNAIVEELVGLGYKVEFMYAKPLPNNCPSGQFDFNIGHITVKWPKDEKEMRE